MAEKDLTMEDDWGAKGAQATGAQVQKFLKDQIKSLKAAQDEANPQLRAATDGCFVIYHCKSDNIFYAVPYWEWTALEKAGEVADGVLVLIDGRTPIIVSPTGTQLKWSKNLAQVDTNVGIDFKKAYADYSGQTKTAAIMTKGVDLFGAKEEDWTQYAPAWCNAYDRSHDKGDGTMIGIGPGHWWLPSIAELIIIWKHKYAINQCLSVISGASPLAESKHWSSTEMSMPTTWYLDLSNGNLYSHAKNEAILAVRAVAAYCSRL